MNITERIMHGGKDALVKELADVAVWARNLTPQEWHNITHDTDGGLNGVMARIVSSELPAPAEKRKMQQYIGTKIIDAEPAFRYNGKVYPKTGPYPKSMDLEDGYSVRYPDGYESWSPKDVFEEAYRPTDGMNFGLAVEAMKKGCKVARKGWNGKGIYLELQVPDEHSKMTLPYIYIVTNRLISDNPYAPKGCVPWLASQTDMLSDDWYIVE